MVKSIADMKAEASAAEPVEVLSEPIELCLAQHLVAKIHTLIAEKQNLAPGKPKRIEDPEAAARVRKGGQSKPKPHPRVAEIDAEVEAAYDEMRDYTGILRLRRSESGDWFNWTATHEPREGNALDEEVAYGYANATDLIADLGTWAATWNDEPIEDWPFIASRLTPGDLKKLAKRVVSMHEGEGAVPKSRPASSGDQTSATA